METAAIPAPAPTLPPLPLLLELIARHAKYAGYLALFKRQEMLLRKKIIALTMPNAERGTNKLDLTGQALTLKAVIKQDITADEAGLQNILDTIPATAAVGLMKWKADFSLSKFLALEQQYQDMLAANVTIKDQSPSLEYDGEVPEQRLLNGMLTKDGILYQNGFPIDQETADNLAFSLGLAGAIELVKLLDELQ